MKSWISIINQLVFFLSHRQTQIFHHIQLVYENKIIVCWSGCTQRMALQGLADNGRSAGGCRVPGLHALHFRLLQCIQFDTTIIILPLSRDRQVACSCCPSVKNPGTDSWATGHRSGPRSASSGAGSSGRPDSFHRREWSSLSCARPPDDVTNPDMTTTGPRQQ